MTKRNDSSVISTWPNNPLRMSEVHEKEVDWLWDNRIPIGALTMVAGDPGVGKSFLCAAILSKISTGEALPGDVARPPRDCLYYSAEDSPSHTIKPRLRQCNADMDRVFVQPNPLTLNDEGLAEIERNISSCAPVLVIIDPIVAYLKGNTDMFKANDIRSNLKHIQAIAMKYECAVVIISHTNKNSIEQKASFRAQGSIDFLASVRSMFVVAANELNQNEKFLAHVKSNLSAQSKTLTYRIGNGHFEWGQEIDKTLAEIERDARAQLGRNKPSPELESAKRFILEQLEEGATPSKVIFDNAKQNGISDKTLRRAKDDLSDDVKWYRNKDQVYWELKEYPGEIYEDLYGQVEAEGES